MTEFVALDFETANGFRESACSLGMVKCNESGQILDEYYTLIKPPNEFGEFSPMTVQIHGIHKEDVYRAPQWKDIISQIRFFVQDLPIVAHNMPFDGSVINHLTDYFQEEAWTNTRHCTLKLSRNLLKGQLYSFGLEPVYDFYYPDTEFDHHNALSDARVCALIFARMIEDFGIEAINDITVHGARSVYSKSSQRTASSEHVRIDRAKNHKIPYVTRKVAFLTGAHVAITGTLSYGSRSQMEALIVSLGGTVSSAVTARTTVLLVGHSDSPQQSSKLTRARLLQSQGVALSIMSEDEFIRALQEVDKEFA